MAEQAAIGQDLIDFADALRLPRFAVAATTGAAARRASLRRFTPSVCGPRPHRRYSIQNTIAPPRPGAGSRASPLAWWLSTERGRAGLAANRRSPCRLLWETWSPTWRFSAETFDRTAASFDNPDFVDVVIHSYRHRNGNAPGEPRFVEVERRLAQRPAIQTPAITLQAPRTGSPGPPQTRQRSAHRSPPARARIVAGAGHFVPREKPDAVSSAMLELLAANR
jgi:pimeloyl-ACP methyl ester carboxylesterase